MCHRWWAPDVAARPHRMLAIGYEVVWLHIGKSMVDVNTKRSDAKVVGGCGADIMGKSNAFRILVLSLWH